MPSLHSIFATMSLCSAGVFVAALVPVNTPSPMLEPAFTNCLQFHIAGEGEDCNAIIAAAQLSRDEFFRINPAVGGEAHCKDRVIPHTWYCARARDPDETAPGQPSGPGPRPTLEPTQTSPTFKKPKDNAHGNGNGNGNGMGLGRGKDRNREPTHKTKHPTPKITKGPEAPQRCYYGQCWYEFAQLSFKGEQALREASELCTKLFNTKCLDHRRLGFPDGVNEGCKDCDELSSGCPCFTGKKFHTYTDGPMFHPERFNNPPDVFGPNDFDF